VPERQLDYWMRDIGTLPDTMFFDVIDIIIEHAGKRTAERPTATPAAPVSEPVSYKTAA